MRSKIILLLAEDPCVSAAAEKLDLSPRTIRFWRDRFLAEGRKGLQTRKRPGAPVRIDAVSRCQIIAMACGKPSDFGVYHRLAWTIDTLLETYLKRFPELAAMSRTSVVKILNEADIHPHRMRLWLHSPDPLFREKVVSHRQACKIREK